ncbi:MAG TPA: DUF1415 domain-containing protein [Marinospirillum sp.]|uniref:DUF1415 domain-containing protein n=1 Tax=Marinospirillum sp. TaxID=2183934 RepID=UPI002B47B0E8|nr:DUF1415 domain-containing protein [Marinospirillum sp.]HKM15700.1 DUF1415 domain-containing protein [Marinospirillum sp.]
MMNDNKTLLATRQWVDTMVVGMNLCPFAKRELVNNRVRFITTPATTEEALLMALQTELALLNTDSEIETTLLIHPDVLQDFYDFNDFLNLAEGLLVEMALDGIYQIASFHPDYQFGGTQVDDAENYTNRSPYPMLHLIREASLALAIASHPDVDGIPKRNIALMNTLGTEKLKALLDGLFNLDK